MNIDWTQIIIALIGFISAIITAVVVPYIKSKTTEKQRQNILTSAQVFVNAAEQMYNAGLLSIPKKEYVKELLQKEYPKIDWELIEAYLENSVFNINKEE